VATASRRPCCATAGPTSRALAADSQYLTVRNLLRNGLEAAPIERVPERADSAGAFLHGAQAMVAGGGA
jgi:hypothetical protein